MIAAEIARRGMACTVTTGGYRLSPRMAERIQRRGMRERLELVEPAPGTPFDHGIFQIVEEPI